jgi:hypothetical protein
MLLIDRYIKLNVNIQFAGFSDSFSINHNDEHKSVLTLTKICYNISYCNRYFWHTTGYNFSEKYLAA